MKAIYIDQTSAQDGTRILAMLKLEIMRLTVSSQESVDQLVIKIGTVKNHVHSIFENLNVNSRGEAAAYLAFIKK